VSSCSLYPWTDEHLCQHETVPPKIRGAPTNHLRVFKDDGGIEGQYFVNVSIPPAPQLAISGAPENLSFHTKNGTVNVDVWVTGNNALKRFSMKLCSDNGHVYAKLVRLLVAFSKMSSQQNKKTHSMMSSLSTSPARPFTLIFFPHMEISPSRCPAVSAGQ
jgi:hypothetical protein